MLTKVITPALENQKNILLDAADTYGGKTFYTPGKNCISPKGPSQMIPPDDRIFALISEAGQMEYHHKAEKWNLLAKIKRKRAITKQQNDS